MTSELSLYLPAAMSAPAATAAAAPLPRMAGSGRAGTAPGNATARSAAAATDVLSRAAQRVADSLGSGNSFNFMVDSETGMTIVKVINRSTGELVRQIPSEEIVHIAQLLQQDQHQPVVDVMA